MPTKAHGPRYNRSERVRRDPANGGKFMAESLGSTTLAQVALVVRDIEEAARRWADVLGMPVPEILTTAPGDEVAQTYRGRPSNARAKLAFFNLGQVQLELIEPRWEARAPGKRFWTARERASTISRSGWRACRRAWTFCGSGASR